MGDVLKYTLGGAVSLFALRLAIEQGEFVTGWVFEQLWRGLEFGTGGRVKPRSGAKVGAWVGRKIRGWVSFGFWTVAEPFVVILRSFLPEREPEQPEQPKAEEATASHPEPAPALEPAPKPAREKAKPTEAEFKAAMADMGLSSSTPQAQVARTWAKLQNSTDEEVVKKALAAWMVICDYRGIRKD